jgi:hypothetical protein
MMGLPSDATVTNALAGSDLDVFETGSAYSGITFRRVFGMETATPMNANQTCSQDQIQRTPQE